MQLIYIANIRMPTEKAHGHQISKMCEQFSREGEKVELWVPARRSSLEGDIFSFYNLENNFKVRKIFCLDLFFLEKYIGPLAFWLEFLSFYFSALIRAAFLAPKTLIYTREVLVCLFRIFFFRVIYECHSIPKKEKSFFMISRLADKIITISANLKEIFLRQGFRENKILVAPDAVDLSIFDLRLSTREARQKLGLPPEGKIIIYTGKLKTMDMDKGVGDILAALAKLPADVLFLAIGGSEEDIAFYQKQAQELKVAGKVKFITHVSQNKLAIYQKAADILLMPFPFSKHYAYFMSPLKMFEYMASQRPIIASDLPSIREVLNKENCVFCQPDNPADLAGKISLLLKDETLARKVARGAYQDVDKYDWQQRVENILKFIR